MLNIYYGRENLDKSKFIFDNIEGKALLIVPDQYTLEAERDAFFYLNKRAIIDIEVMSFSRLGEIIVSKAGRKVDVLGKAGRQMILTKIIREKAKELEVFYGSSRKIDFVNMVHDLISELKQHNTSKEAISEAIDAIEKDSLLKRKLKEILIIYTAYQNYTEGKYLDNEDYISFYVSLMEKSGYIHGKTIWIYGFDSFSDKNISIIKELNRLAINVNLVLNYDPSSKGEELFSLSRYMIDKLEKIIGDVNTEAISASYKRMSQSSDIVAIEKEIFKFPVVSQVDNGNIRLQKALNPYNEAVNAALFVLNLVRDKGYRYNEIALISNDIENKGSLYQRVFSEYGMDLYIDIKRGILHHPAVNYILALMEVVRHNYQREDVIRMVKSGLVIESDEDIEKLEIYSKIFNIKGILWRRDFSKGVSKYGEEYVNRLNEIRAEIINPIMNFNKAFTDGKTVEKKVNALYEFLEKISINEKLEDISKKLEDENKLELAQENSQIWNAVTSILGQMVEGLGDEKISKDDFVEILKSGFEAIEIGLIPPAVDGLIMGTMQRTRRGHIKATVILDAVEGTLPSQTVETGILSEDERAFLNDNNINICKMSQVKSLEESMAIYKNISKTEDILYMSYAMADNKGSGQMPSSIFAKVRDIFPNLEVAKDRVEKHQLVDLIGGVEATKSNMINAIVKMMEDGEIDPMWIKVYKYFESIDEVDQLIDVLTEKMGESFMSLDQASELYKRNMEDMFVLSPSRLEKFGNCPFAHFVSYGLRPEENREYFIGGAEAGSIYHDCLMILARDLTSTLEKGQEITDENSIWMNITKESMEDRVKKILNEISQDYMEGIMSHSKYEQYRAKRIERVCCDSAWIAIKHVRSGAIKTMDFEVEFGKDKTLPPIDMDVTNGKAAIEGKIDRVDILEGDYSKVIDYKSGNDVFLENEARVGMKLQLFIYLMATVNEKIQPGGAFYFHLDEAKATGVLTDEDATNKIDAQFKLNGFLLDNHTVLDSIDKEAGRFSNVFIKGKNVLKQNNFDELMQAVKDKVHEMADQLTKGDISIEPKKSKEKTSCDFCPYKGICKFDISLDGCNYTIV